MMGRAFALVSLGALLAGALAMPAAAPAQCRLCATPTTEPTSEGDQEPVRIEGQARLDFSPLVVLDSTPPATARLLPDGTSSVSGSIGALSGRAMVGSVVVRGEAGRLVRIGLPASIALFGLTRRSTAPRLVCSFRPARRPHPPGLAGDGPAGPAAARFARLAAIPIRRPAARSGRRVGRLSRRRSDHLRLSLKISPRRPGPKRTKT